MDCSTFEDTIVAPATVPGTGAVTMIRVSGRDALPVVGKVVSCPGGQVESAPANTIRYGLVRSEDGQVLDEVMVSVFRAPRSYTGEDSAEITCHASSYVASELMRLLCKAGARMASPGEFTRRAFVNGKMDLAQAEAVADVISSSGAASLRVAMNQLRGGYSSELKALRSKLMEMASLLELELDFSEEDVQFADREKLTGLLDESRSRLLSLTDSFRFGNALKE
jgi:tRNA modification GTPase